MIIRKQRRQQKLIFHLGLYVNPIECNDHLMIFVYPMVGVKSITVHRFGFRDGNTLTDMEGG